MAWKNYLAIAGARDRIYLKAITALSSFVPSFIL